MNQQGGIMGQSTPPVAPPPGAGVPELLGPADAAKILGVSEDDVMAVLNSGELKGKKIGSTWRITRAAIDEFLKS
jgi:excisionase family DNA binding protein